MTLLKYEDFLNDKAGTIATLAQALGQPSRTDVHENVDRQFQPPGSRAPYAEFFGERNLATSSTCAATMPLASDTTFATDRIDASRRAGRMICGFA